MDTVLLQKRISFLEEAISILLENHQLKGIYMVHRLTQQEVERTQKSHKLRDRMVWYINKYGKEDGVDGRRRDGSSSSKK